MPSLRSRKTGDVIIARNSAQPNCGGSTCKVAMEDDTSRVSSAARCPSLSFALVLKYSSPSVSRHHCRYHTVDEHCMDTDALVEDGQRGSVRRKPSLLPTVNQLNRRLPKLSVLSPLRYKPVFISPQQTAGAQLSLTMPTFQYLSVQSLFFSWTIYMGIASVC